MGSASDASNRHGLTSEPERWIVSMIRCHGPKMVAYFEKCVENLVRTYLAELEKQQRWEQLKQLNAFGSAPTSSVSLVAALRSILHDIVNLPGTKKRRQMKASEVNATAKLAMDSSVPSYESSVPVSISNDDVQGYSATSEPKSFEWLLSNISQKPIVGSDSTGSPVENNGDVFYNIIEPFLHQGSVDSTSSLDLPVSMPMHVPVSMVSSHEQLTILSELPAVSEVPSMAHVTNECRVDTTSVSFSPFESCIGAHQTSAIGLLDDLSRATYSWSDYGLN
ncbi:hypothetical protein LPJ73_009281 [Coemansia sp. RSA 2703]|nr:hypothetical protein LPJ73_009281 [Coemansia sp. RSA 2703]KAJ2378668.1 hypothetical protein GGI05_006702 [Coemansia sp. RSA 2603]